MTVGSPTTATLDAAKKHIGLRFVCLQNKGTRFPKLLDFPPKACKGGIMAVHHFPRQVPSIPIDLPPTFSNHPPPQNPNLRSCWNGRDVNSLNHQDHMYNTGKEDFAAAAPCPSSHPIRMPQIAYEMVWDTAQFSNMWPKDGSNPFFLSYNDNKGYGTHADYLFG
jgi:hypothetical protein